VIKRPVFASGVSRSHPRTGVDGHPVGVRDALPAFQRPEAGPSHIARILFPPVHVRVHPGADRADDQRGDLRGLRFQLGSGAMVPTDGPARRDLSAAGPEGVGGYS
jgi:hypothetical protein